MLKTMGTNEKSVSRRFKLNFPIKGWFSLPHQHKQSYAGAVRCCLVACSLLGHFSNKRRCFCMCDFSMLIDPMQKWLPLNYSVDHIQKCLTSFVPDNKCFRFLISKTRLVRLF